MLKSAVFISGLASGTYLGVYLRENGYGLALTRAYHAYKNDDTIDTGRKPKQGTIDDMFKLYYAGLLTGSRLEAFEEMIKSKQYNKIEEVVRNDDNAVLKDREFDDFRRDQIVFGYQNKNNNKKY